jgi:murein DD-endopeptidase MepM/ murein hydrolase activator NlpD
MHMKTTNLHTARLNGLRFLVTMAIVFVCLTGIAHATTESELKEQLGKLQKGMESAAQSYEEQEQKLSEIQAQVEDVAGRMNVTKHELGNARKHLAQIVVDRYRGTDDYQLLEIMLSSKSFKDFIALYEYSSRIGEYYANAVEDTMRLSEQLEEQSEELAALQEDQAKVVKAHKSKLAKLQDQLAGKEAEFAALREELAAQRAAANVAAGLPANMDVTVSVGANGFVFPVVGSYSYIDSFTAPRATGMHQATDIMAAYGTPVVAFTGGYWQRCDNALGGIAGYLNGSNGWKAYYGHLQSAIGSGPVSAGQVIGAVGDTGNATGIPHLHLEMWDASGRLINPYPLLRAME